MLVNEYPEPYRSILLSLGANEETSIFMRNGYPVLRLRNEKDAGFYIHRVVAARKAGVDSLPRTVFVHHINEDKTDFRPENLHTCTLGEHNGLHRRFGKANHFYGKTHSDQVKAHISSVAKQRTDLTRDKQGKFICLP